MNEEIVVKVVKDSKGEFKYMSYTHKDASTWECELREYEDKDEWYMDGMLLMTTARSGPSRVKLYNIELS